MRILIVDDDANSRLVLARTLEHLKHEVVVAPGGFQAWRRYSSENFQFVIADFEMPGLDGPGLCRRIREAARPDYTYIVLLATEHNRAEIVVGLDAGADAFLVKPFHPTELDARIRAGLRILQLEQSLREKTEQNKEINKRMRWYVQREHLVNQIICRLNESLDLDEMLRNTARSMQETLQASRAFVLLYDEAMKVQRVAGEHCAQGIAPMGGCAFPVDFSEITAAYARNTATPIDDLVKENKYLPDEIAQTLMMKHDVRSLLMAPILHQGKWLGTVGLHQCETPRAWSEDEVTLLSEIAQPLAMAVTNARLYHQVQEQAVRDGLTGVFNRRYFDQMLELEIERAKRYNHDLSLIMIDLDYLKKINDELGHQAGDKAIREIGQVLKKLHRRVDTIARYGGEEFVALLPHTSPKGAAIAAETWRQAINEIKLQDGWHLTASIGVATLPLQAITSAQLIKAADDAMYRAKQTGRNRVCVAEEIEATLRANSQSP
jgi:two-component system, cell cycle response regulator